MKVRSRRFLALVPLVFVALLFLVPSKPALTARQQAIVQLAKDGDGDVEITWNPATATPSFIRGRINLGRAPSSLNTALAVADRYSSLLGVKQAASELSTVEAGHDDLGMQHVTLQQQYQGIPVYNAYVKVHSAKDGQVVAISNGFVPNVALTDTTPIIAASEALATANKALPNAVPSWGPTLVVYAPPVRGNPGRTARLAWVLELRDDATPARNLYVVDAVNGDILDVIEQLNDAPLAARASGGSAGGQHSSPKPAPQEAASQVNVPDLTSTGFVYPTGKPGPYEYAGWLAGGPNRPPYQDGYYHLGQDMEANEGDPIYAIADGQIVYVSVNDWGTLDSPSASLIQSLVVAPTG